MWPFTSRKKSETELSELMKRVSDVERKVGTIIEDKESMLETFSEGRYSEIALSFIGSSLKGYGFRLIDLANQVKLVDDIINRHPRIVALFLSQLHPYFAAEILFILPRKLRDETCYFIAIQDKVDKELLDEVKTIHMKMIDMLRDCNLYRNDSGIRVLGEIIRTSDKKIIDEILESFELKDSKMTKEIRNNILNFDHFIKLDNLSMQRVLKDVDIKDLSIALKGTDEEARKKVFNNISKISEQAVTVIQEGMENIGPVHLRDIEEVKERILDLMRSLEEDGEIARCWGWRQDTLVE